jgi:hypothetical protein
MHKHHHTALSLKMLICRKGTVLDDERVTLRLAELHYNEADLVSELTIEVEMRMQDVLAFFRVGCLCDVDTV